MFCECPRCFWLQINENIKRPSGPFPSIATGIDGVIKKYFDEYRQKNELPPYLKTKINGTLVPQSLRSALKFTDYKNNVIFYGYLDECVILEGNFYAPLDNKTRASIPEGVHPAYQLQLDCYTFLLEKNNYQTKNVAFLVYYTPDSVGTLFGSIKFNFTIIEVQTNHENAKKVLYEALETLKKPIPDSNLSCAFCNWANKVRKSRQQLFDTSSHPKPALFQDKY